MKYKNDDALSAVDARFLGPKGTTLPFQVRYVMYGIGGLVMLIAMILERKAGIGISPASVLYTLMVTVAVTTWLGRFVDFERPFRTMLVTFAHEVNTPRPARPQTATIIPRRLR